MRHDGSPVVVFGATGQQGGSVTAALRSDGWALRAFVRDAASGKALALARSGVELVQGDLRDDASIGRALAGAYGVFSVQPSSGQGAAYGVSDDDEVRFGTVIADLAVTAGVEHLVYASTNALRSGPTGMGHFDSKLHVERHVRPLPIGTTIVRPSTFMELLTTMGPGLAQGLFTFFMQPDRPMQFIAVRDIGRFVARVFAEPGRFRSETMEIAGDEVTGHGLAARFSHTAGRPIRYRRFPEQALADDPFLARLAALVDEGPLRGGADLAGLRGLVPDLLTLDAWLAQDGAASFQAALGERPALPRA